MPWMHDGMGGKPEWADDAWVDTWMSQGWAPVQMSGGQQNVATNMSAVQAFLDAAFRAGELEQTQYANMTQRLQTQGNLGIDAFNAATNRGTAAGNLYLGFRGPKDYMQRSNLDRSSTGQVSDLWAAAQGLTGGLEYGAFDPNNLDPLTWDNSGMGDMFKLSGDGQGGDGAGGGDEGPAWKARLRAEGIDYRDVPEPVLRLMKSGDPETRNQAIADWKAGKTIRKDFNYGDPSRGKQGESGAALEPFLDAYGNWVFPEGYTGPTDLPTPPGVILPGQDAPYQTRQEYEQGQSQPQDQGGSVHDQGTGLGAQSSDNGGLRGNQARPAATAPTEADYRNFYNTDTVMKTASQQGTPANREETLEGNVMVTFSDGNRRLYNKQGRELNPQEVTMAVTERNRLAALKTAQQNTPKPVGGSTQGAHNPVPNVPRPPSVPANPPGGGGSKGANPGNTSSNDRDTLVGTRAEEAKKTGVHTNAASRRRAKGGMDVVRYGETVGPGPATEQPDPPSPHATYDPERQSWRDARDDSEYVWNNDEGTWERVYDPPQPDQFSDPTVDQGNLIPNTTPWPEPDTQGLARGGMKRVTPPRWHRALGGEMGVVTEPTRFAEGGQQFLVGEGGKDELVTKARYPDATVVRVDPLERGDRGVTDEMADLANALVPGDPYSEKDGPIASPTDADAPCPCCGMPIGAHEGMGEDDAPMPMGADMPPEDMERMGNGMNPEDMPDWQLAMGGTVVTPLAPGATLKPSAKPWKQPKPKKGLPAPTSTEPQYVKNGKIQAVSGPGKFKTVSVADNMPYVPSDQIRSSVWNNLSPDDQALIESKVTQAGDTMEAYLHRRAMGMQPLQQKRPFSGSLKRGF